MKVLLVEDCKSIRLENERALLKAGYDVITAQDGRQALEIAGTHAPDLILLDLLLPVMDGVQVLRQLKKDAATKMIPVVVLSSLSSKNHDRLVAEGAEEYLEKNIIMLPNRVNQLPVLLREIICRINRKNGNLDLVAPITK